MKCRLQGRESVVLQHMQQCLPSGTSAQLHPDVGEASPTVFPALSRPRKRIFAFLCIKPEVDRAVSTRGGNAPDNGKRTKLGEDVPEPVDDEHCCKQRAGKRGFDRLSDHTRRLTATPRHALSCTAVSSTSYFVLIQIKTIKIKSLL